MNEAAALKIADARGQDIALVLHSLALDTERKLDSEDHDHDRQYLVEDLVHRLRLITHKLAPATFGEPGLPAPAYPLDADAQRDLDTLL